jgi:inosine-uridine nucleoside N-ribohydrolase
MRIKFIEMHPQTHGNASSEFTAVNAARCLLAFGTQPHVRVYPGAPKPLLLSAKPDPEIHGDDGLGGVEGLPPADSAEVLALFATDEDGFTIRALEGMAKSVKETWNKGAGEKITVISSGPMTNIALFVSVYPDLLDAIEEFVFMGGGVGMGNRSAVAEYNILCDREFYLATRESFPILPTSSCNSDCSRRPSQEDHDSDQCYTHCHSDKAHTSSASNPRRRTSN